MNDLEEEGRYGYNGGVWMGGVALEKAGSLSFCLAK